MTQAAEATDPLVSALLRPGPVEQELVTVVVPARDEQAHLAACLDSVLAQTHRCLQVVVVDGASTDRTAEIVREYAARDPRVELLSNPQGVIPVSLNLALAAARGRWLVRVDAHATVPPDYVATAVELLSAGRWAAVGGRKDGVGTTPAGRAVAAVMASRFGVGGSTYHHGTRPQEVEHVPFGAYSVEVARELGGWDPRLTVNQDFELDHRLRKAGHRLLFDPRLTIQWHCRQSVPDLFRQYHRYGRGKVRVARLHPDSVRPRHLAAPALVAALGVAAVIVPRRPAVAAAVMAPYAALLAGVAAQVGRGVDRQARPWVAPGFLAMHLGWGLGFWRGVGDLLLAPAVGAGPAPTAVRPCPACAGTDVRTTGLLRKGRYRLWRCADCRTQYFLDEDERELGEDAQYWEAYKFDVYGDPAVQTAFERRYGALLEQARRRVGPVDSVLDVGCGIGNFVDYAQRSGLRAVGTDVALPAVAAARERGLTVWSADELAEHVPDGSVDALTMWDVVEHLVDPRSVLADLVPKVRSGGVLLFETPDAAFPVRDALLALNRWSRGRVDLTSPMYYWEHKLYLTEQGLRALLDAVGVDLVLTRRATSVREKMTRQFAVNAGKGSWKARVLRRTWPVLETAFRATGRGNKLLVVARKR